MLQVDGRPRKWMLFAGTSSGRTSVGEIVETAARAALATRDPQKKALLKASIWQAMKDGGLTAVVTGDLVVRSGRDGQIHIKKRALRLGTNPQGAA